MDKVLGKQAILVETTTETDVEAREIALKLLSDRVAGCIQVTKIDSFFFWEGSITEQKEYKVCIKTMEHLLKSVTDTIKALHTYNVPEIVVYKAEYVDEKYKNWMTSALSTEK